MAKHYTFITVGVVLLTSLWLFPVASGEGPELLHVLGIVTAIDAKRIDIKTTKGPVVPVLLSKQVKFKNKSNPTSNDAPTVGDRVIIEATKDDKTKKISATVVHYSPNKTVSPPR
jgi:hypothetical protein